MQTFIQSKSNCFGWCSYMHATLNQNPLLFHKIGFKPTKTFGTPTHSSSIFSKATRSDTSSTELPVMSGVEDKYREAGLRRDRMPEHVAVILDGNRRWFKKRGLELDYEPFLRHNLLVADLCIKWGIGTTTCFIYALENMRRTQETNELIFRQFEKFLAENLENFLRKNMKVSVIGESSMYPESLKDMIKQVEEATTKFSKLELMFAVCYGGTRDVLHAARSICRNVKDGVVEPEDVSEKLVEQALYTKMSRAPQVDLLIRTGGHLRLSNYLMWQIAEAELYFTNSETMAPNFGEHVFLDALRSYQQTERTFGK
ncbi:cis-prenyltransferase 4, chloroplastic-like [Silene latifolia]|uniref:cis-prenyltransferase 4, chloroplastic-like n=1 Tax=Silene latifolia TaxID=37657 RepID=UPI003D783F75